MSKGNILALLVVAVFAGCATSTVIVTDPPGAKVYDDKGSELGTTPYTFESSMWLWEKAELEVKKEGYQSKSFEVSRSEIDIVPTIGSAALFVCLGFVPFGLTGVVLFLAGGMKFPDETKISMDRAGGTATDAVPPPIACPAGLPVAYMIRLKKDEA